MASLVTGFANLCLLLAVLSCMRAPPAAAFVFEVGEKAGWAVPPSKNAQIYNEWASDNRFQIGDSVEFKYDKDSVMVVSEDDYKKCHSAHPIFFSNNGHTMFKFDHSGMYYFISGVSGHCQRGQKMIIKVMGHSEGPSSSPSHGNQTGVPSPPGSDSDDKSDAAPLVLAIAPLLFLPFLMGFLLF